MTPLDLEGLTWAELATCRWPQLEDMLWDLDPVPAPNTVGGFYGSLGWILKWRSGYGYALGPFEVQAAEVFIGGGRAAEIFIGGHRAAEVLLPGGIVTEVTSA